MANGEGSIRDRLEAEGAGPQNVPVWHQPGEVEDISAGPNADGARRVVSLHIGHGLTSIRGAKTDETGGDSNG